MTNKRAGISEVLLRPVLLGVLFFTAEAGTAGAGHIGDNPAAASADTEAEGPADNHWEPADTAEQACRKAVRAEA